MHNIIKWEEGWSGDEALRFVGTRCSEAGAPYASGKELEEDIPSDWFGALNSVAQKTEIGRLFCHDCFEDWRYGAIDDVASTKVAAAIRRLRARDDALEVLDLRNEGPLGWELAGVLGAAAGHSITLVSLDVASCEIGDRGCAALCTALLHGTAGVGGTTGPPYVQQLSEECPVPLSCCRVRRVAGRAVSDIRRGPHRHGLLILATAGHTGGLVGPLLLRKLGWLGASVVFVVL